jgi:hypothetical protein
MNALAPYVDIVPKREEELYVMLPADVRKELDGIAGQLGNLLNAKSLLAACKAVAPTIGMNSRQLYERVRSYIATRDWKALVNKAAAGSAFWESTKPIGLPVAFQKFYQKLCEDNQKVDKGGYRELILIWKTHLDSNGTYYDAIPGYDTWPQEDPRYRHPAGWSYRNLSRYSPDLYDSAAARVGPFAASLYRPSVLTTRVGLAICERVQFDDHEYNVKVHFPRQPKAMRPRGFTAAEQLSAYLVPSFKPTLWDMDEEKKKALTEKDMMWFTIYWLCQIGYRTDERGTLLVVEKGTAAIKEAFAERIYRATGKHVRVSEPGMFSRPSHKGQFSPRAKGNFKHKPLVESSFYLIDNFFAGLPGQVGIDRLSAPEEMHGREQYLKSVLKVAESLPKDRAELLRIPMLNWAQFLNKGLELYDAINRNTDHEIEGWQELGYQDLQWRLKLPDSSYTPWQSQNALLALPEPQRNAIHALTAIDTTGELTRAVNLSRHQVFHTEHAKALKSGVMEKLSPWRYCELMGVENGYEVVVNKQSQLVIESREFGMKPLVYLARVNGRHLPVGEKYLAFINPWSPRIALLCKHDGAAVGLCEQWDIPCANDSEARLKMTGAQAQWEAERRAGLNERHADRALEIAHMREHNEAVESGVTPEDQQMEKRLDRAAKKETSDFRALTSEAKPQADSQAACGVSMEDLREL